MRAGGGDMIEPAKARPPSRGDRVRASSYRTRGNGREFISARLGTVEMVYRDQVWVRLTGFPKPVPFLLSDVEVVND
jgi:hypothetical protein